MKAIVRYINIFAVVLLFAFCSGAKAQSDVAYGYQFSTSVDSSVWIDIDSETTFEPWYSYPKVVHLPFDFTFYNRTYSDISIYYNGNVLFGNMINQLSSNYTPFPYDREVACICGYGFNGRCTSFGNWCSPPDSTGNRIFILQYTVPYTGCRWQIQLFEADNSINMVYQGNTVSSYYSGYVGLQMGRNRFIAVSPDYSSLCNCVWTAFQDSITYEGWPGQNRCYRFVPVDTICLSPAVVGVSSHWQNPGTVQLLWNRCSRYSAYAVEYGLEGFTPGTGAILNTPDTSVTLTGLVAGQSYDAYISALCIDSQSTPSVFVQFQPPCPPSADNQILFHDLYNSTVSCRTGTTSYPSVNAGIVDSGFLSPCSRHTVHSDPLERDPRTDYQLYTIPRGHCVSVRLGNWQINAEQESITYTLQIDTNNYDLIILRYALVEEDPSHVPANNPQFEFDITDLAGHSISDCYHGFFVSGDLSGWNQGIDDVLWRDWDAVGIDLSSLHGQTVCITLSSRDCAQTGHFGYGYFTLESAHKHFRSTSCGEITENTFHAPEGFSYRWYNAADTAVTLSTSDSLHVSDTGVYCCRVSHQLSGYQCGFVMSTYMGSRYPVAAFTHEQYDSCGSLIRFINHSVIARDSTHAQLTVFPCEQYLWDFGDGNTSTEVNPVHSFGEGIHIVTLYAMLAGGDCTDSVNWTFTVTLQHDTIVDSICSGQEYLFFGRPLTEAGEYTHVEGCQHTTLILKVNPVYSILVADTFAVGGYYLYDRVRYYRPGSYIRLYTSMGECDSIVTLHLCCIAVLDTTVCSSSLPYVWHGVTFIGEETDTLRYPSYYGADSIVVLNFHVLPSFATNVVDTLRQGDTYLFHGMEYLYPGVYTVQYESINGCDSNFTLHLCSYEEWDTTVCSDALPMMWRNVLFLSGGIANLIFPSILGVDSIVVLNFHVLPSYATEEADTFRLGDTYLFHGMEYRSPGVYTAQFETVDGCDSTFLLHLSSYEEWDTVVCADALPVVWRNVLFNAAGCDTLHLTSVAGTDSIVMLSFGVLPMLSLELEPELICRLPGGHWLSLPDTLCYRITSDPADPGLSFDWVSGHDLDGGILLQPADTTFYYLLANHCDGLYCPFYDTLLLAPVHPVEVGLMLDPESLTEDNMSLSVIDLTGQPHQRQWYFNDIPWGDTTRVVHYMSSAQEDSVRVMLVATTPDCSDTAYASVPVKIQSLWFPNVFTPGEATNNFFRGYGVNVRDYDLKIFTRWGDCIFHTNNIDECWNGTYRGVPSPPSAYVYLCHYTTLDGEPRTVAGTVTLVR
ncbi:MAG: gliding motility-associated C-terminal domain-containing protein [Bacteroidales bacterium]|nr:gliding motility-associated C-terminal domain-containing protein [Bacteroidales bacterium]